MSKLALKAENISKQYRLGEVGTGTLSHDLNRMWHKLRGKEDPYLKIGEANNRATKGESDYVWSLQDINFEIEQGDAVGIIGKNGAGKSTLLKILSKVTKPTTGNIKVNGRIASLLEVGTGFNPEMTGRENIYLNGAILGMRKAEITRKLDEIVDFSGVERYLDTPVKRYSSGMYVRLAFAVAAHLESEILIVDEVLAVGDAEFQKKCLGKMGDVSKGEGRTVLFVSHNMGAVKSLCNKGVLLQNGFLNFQGNINNTILEYLNGTKYNSSWIQSKKSNQDIHLQSIETKIEGMQPSLRLIINTDVLINISINKKAFLAFYISSIDSVALLEAIPEYNLIDCSHSNTKVSVVTEINLDGFIPGEYLLGVWLGFDHSMTIDWQKDIIKIEILDSPVPKRTIPFSRHSGFHVPNSKVIQIKTSKSNDKNNLY
jgi:lipopolysaccharide transport system ATP-binding protein